MNDNWKWKEGYYDEYEKYRADKVYIPLLECCEQRDMDGKLYDTSSKTLYKRMCEIVGKYSGVYYTDSFACSDPVEDIFNTEYPIFFGDEAKKSKIIETLETLGGINSDHWAGNSVDAAYGISKKGKIICVSLKIINKNVLDWIQKIDDFLMIKR